MTKEKINFRQARDFTETFNVSIKFLRQNFKMFFQCLILIAGPFVLMSAIAGAFYQSHAISMMSLAKLGSNVNAFSRIIDQFGWTYAIFIIATIVASLMMVNTVFSFMIIYNEKGPEEITMNEVSTKVIKNIGNVLSIFLSFTFTTMPSVSILKVRRLASQVLMKSSTSIAPLQTFNSFNGVLKPH